MDYMEQFGMDRKSLWEDELLYLKRYRKFEC